MAQARKASQARKTGRRWHIPPPLVHGAQPLEGGELLAEGSGPEAVFLWQALRDVVLWAGTPPDERGLLFRGDGGPAARLSLEFEVEGVVPQPSNSNSTSSTEPLRTLLRLPLESATIQPVAVATACRALSERLEGEGRTASALGFAQAAALAMPGDAQAAFRVGRIARGRADHARAEVWYRRAIGLARQSRDWRLYAQSFRGLGNLYLLRGNLPAARRLQVRALRGARRGGMRLEMGHALHDLFCVEVAAGRAGEAEGFARRAVEAYAARSPRLTELAHDIAYAWMERGEFARALPVFQGALPLVHSEDERLLVRADIARAAAGAGERDLYVETFAAVTDELDTGRFAHVEARAAVELAHGATVLGDWSRALRAGQRARDAARARGEGRVLLVADALLEAAARQQAAPLAPTTPAPVEASDSLADALLGSLRALASAG